MKPIELDPRLTFDSYVVGAGNRLTCAAARRVAESPGTSYNPLFVYSASGLGKTHLLMAVGNHARRLHAGLEVVYDGIEHFIADLTAAIEAGERDAFRNLVQDIGLLLLDDVQFLAGQQRMQEELIRVWDALTARGGQVALASDRPPTEMDALDSRLLSRFSGGLIVDIGAPDYETRVAIVRRKAEERGHTLGPGIAEALARIAFGNVRELQGALNRILAVQELEERAVAIEEVPTLVTASTGGVRTRLARVVDPAEFDRFVEEVAGTVGEVVAATAEEPLEPLPAPPADAAFDALALPDDLLAVRAARAAAEQPGARYNPLFVHERDGRGRSALLAALAAELERRHPDAAVAYLDGAAFEADLIAALERNRVDAFRARYRRADALVLDDVDALAGTERAQEELFHLFEELHRRGAQLAFGARTPPQALTGLEDRLRSRIASGLVVEIPAGAAQMAAPPAAVPVTESAAELPAPELVIQPWIEPTQQVANGNGHGPAPETVSEPAQAPVAVPSTSTLNPHSPSPPTLSPHSPSALDIDAALANLGVPAPEPAPAPAVSLANLMAPPGAPAPEPRPTLDRAFLDREKLPLEWPDPVAWLVEELD